MKTFVFHEQQAGRLLRAADDLYDAFLRTDSGPPQQDTFRQQFETVLGRLEAQGAIRQLGFGQLILLQRQNCWMHMPQRCSSRSKKSRMVWEVSQRIA